MELKIRKSLQERSSAIAAAALGNQFPVLTGKHKRIQS